MYHTEFGNFDGDSWETFCQRCLKIRYKDGSYQSIPAHFGGDLGIEGYTRDGVVFQCYCPDENYDPKELYEHQRAKVTNDLKKLIKNEDELIKFIKDMKIKKWIFLTPEYHNKDIIRHCVKKREEYREKNISCLDEEFDVLVQDIEFFLKEMPLVLGASKDKVTIKAEKVSQEEIVEWEKTEIAEVENIIRKTTATFPPNYNNNLDYRVRKLTNKRIGEYLNGSKRLRRLQMTFQDQYERFMKVVDVYESIVEDKCLYPVDDNKKLFDEIAKELEEKLIEEFGDVLDSMLIIELKQYVISDWLMRCPIDFEI
ncbi:MULTISPECIES: hypothetical protein [Bacillus cereus group]|uniref:hypothetical protein n=1 Tax=Bacillus cereus group TaxID=86661 RepID=UPI000BF6C6D9|nr:hypothetical protein [Bacillus cereus group sp. Bc015]MDA2738624.1 hypothetical protein [Bacillus cereus group sp. Bc015]PFD90257.1 hypothetical protein CN275_07965 [Bacillus anthracis]